MITSAWPVISATLSDPEPGSGVQPLSTTLLLDSEVVTPQINTASGFAYTPSVRLTDGVHTVTAQVYDQAGNQAQSGPWSFTVVDDSAPSLGVTKYYMFGSQRIAMRQDDVVYFLHSDHLGSTSLTTDITGTLVAEVRYLPYGGERWITGTLVTDFTFTGQRAEFYYMELNLKNMTFISSNQMNSGDKEANSETLTTRPGALKSQGWLDFTPTGSVLLDNQGRLC